MSAAVDVTGLFPIDDYQVRSRIGTGQFGVVYRAWSSKRNAEVALKHVAAATEEGPTKIEAEERGAELQQRFALRHPGLVPEIYERGRVASGDYYIAMQFVEGRPLTDFLRNSPVGCRKTAEIGLAIADFLVKLHGLPTGDAAILHSDLKPEHVLVLPDGSLRVLDLGIAKSLQPNKSLTVNTWASAPYASPERLDDGRVRVGDDYWALGVMLFEMSAGYHPYHHYMGGDHTNAVLAAAIRRTEPPALLPPSCDAALAAIVRKMLAPQAAHRYQTAAEIRDDLQSYLDGNLPGAAAQESRASQPTQVLPPRPTAPTAAVRDTVATEPLPPAAVAAAAPRRSATSRVTRATLHRFSLTTAVRVAAALLLILVALTEGAVWLRAERLRQRIGGLEAADVPAVRAELASMRGTSLLALAIPLRLRTPLREQMVSAAERAILDFRSDLSVSEVQWRQARACLGLAAEAAPNDRSVTARAKYVEGHLARIAAQGQTAAVRQARLNEAKSRFIESARLDPSAPDPYLGLARINAYDTHDLEALLLNISEAETRGFKSGRRERAQVGDGHRFKGDRALAQSRTVESEGRRRFLEQAATEFERCAAKFEGLTNYFDAERNLTYCQRQLARVRRELDNWPW